MVCEVFRRDSITGASASRQQNADIGPLKEHAVSRYLVVGLIILLAWSAAIAQPLPTVVSTATCLLLACQIPESVISVRSRTNRAPRFDVGLEIDGKSIRCKLATIGDADDDILHPNCSGVAHLAVRNALDCSDKRVGCIDLHRLEETIGIYGTPAEVKVMLIDGERVVAEKTFSPTYEVSYPNGSECEPQCKSWRTVWTVE